jgi:hypothetical protein
MKAILLLTIANAMSMALGATVSSTLNQNVILAPGQFKAMPEMPMAF